MIVIKNLFVISVVVLFSCTKEEDKSSDLVFLNRDLQGTVQGYSWVYKTGRAKRENIHASNGAYFSFLLTDTLFIDSCTPEENYFFTYPNKLNHATSLFFMIKSDDLFLSPKIYYSSYNYSDPISGGSNPITVFQDQNDSTWLWHALEDAKIEILNFDSTENLIYGRLVGYINHKNVHINGNFKAKLCEY